MPIYIFIYLDISVGPDINFCLISDIWLNIWYKLKFIWKISLKALFLFDTKDNKNQNNLHLHYISLKFLYIYNSALFFNTENVAQIQLHTFFIFFRKLFPKKPDKLLW